MVWVFVITYTLIQGALKVPALVSVQLKGGSEPGNEVIHKSPGRRLGPLIWKREGFNPSGELVNNDENVLLPTAGSWEWAEDVQMKTIQGCSFT